MTVSFGNGPLSRIDIADGAYGEAFGAKSEDGKYSVPQTACQPQRHQPLFKGAFPTAGRHQNIPPTITANIRRRPLIDSTHFAGLRNRAVQRQDLWYRDKDTRREDFRTLRPFCGDDSIDLWHLWDMDSSMMSSWKSRFTELRLTCS